MSFAALAWAAKQRPGNLAAKMVLLGLANFADEHGCAYPSTAALAEFGDMDHKTATAALDKLTTQGLIQDTGDRAGRTKQIKVYRLTMESLPKAEASQKRKPPVFAPKAPQKRGTDTVLEPVSTYEAKASTVEPAPVLKPEHVVEAWNHMADRYGLPKARLTPERRRKLITRIRQHPIEDFTEAIAAIERSSFLRGENNRAWRADLDFLLQPSSFTKLIEGSYDTPSH